MKAVHVIKESIDDAESKDLDAVWKNIESHREIMERMEIEGKEHIEVVKFRLDKAREVRRKAYMTSYHVKRKVSVYSMYSSIRRPTRRRRCGQAVRGMPVLPQPSCCRFWPALRFR